MEIKTYLSNLLDAKYLQRFLPWLILISGLGITLFLRHMALQENHKNIEERFYFRANEMTNNIQSRIHSYKEILLGAKGLFISSITVDRQEFHEYVKQLNLADFYPGIQGLGFALLIAPDALEAHQKKIREEGFPNYAVRPSDRRDIYSSVVYIEPFDWRNQRAFGFDMFSEPTRNAAMQQAMDTNKPTASGMVTLIQETEKNKQPGFLMYLPIYQSRQPINTIEQRRKNIYGWVYAPFRIHDLMNGIMGPQFGELGNTIGFDVYDGNATDPEKLMYDYHQQTGTQRSHRASVFKTIKQIDVGEHTWTISVFSLPSLDNRLHYKEANYIAIAGAALSAMLALIVWLLLSGRERAYAKANEITSELRASELHTKRLNRDLKLLSECNMAMLKIDDEPVLLQSICRMIVEQGNYRMAWVGFAENDEEKSVRLVAESGFDNGYLNSVKISWADNPYGRGPTGSAIRNGITDINHDYLNNDRMAPWRSSALTHGFQSSISIPLSCDKKIIGALTIYAAEPYAFTPDEVELLEELAGDLSYGIQMLRTRNAHKLTEEKIAFMAYHDALTQLPNRILLQELFSEVSQAAERREAMLGIALLDLDNFKHVNDTLGHSLGDKLLVNVTQRLCENIDQTDIISRLNGDKFVLILHHIQNNDVLSAKIQAVLSSLNQPFTVDNHLVDITASFGISIFPNNGKSLDQLIKKADIAMYVAKENGRNTYQFYTEKMDADVENQLQLAGHLHQAIKNNQLSLNYQMQVDIQQGKPIGFEALLRWEHPEKGRIPPSVFIPLAENNGLIIPIGEWVMHEACKQAKTWYDQGYPLVVAINLSAIEFKRGNLLESVKHALEQTGLPPHLLELELTESILLKDMDMVMEMLRQLKALGVKLAIDDFGTGYSSLSYLKRLAVDKLKIDQSFVRDIAIDQNDEAIVNAIIQVGHALQLKVIAEGVEDAVQLDYLKKHQCDEVQGYYFSKPVNGAEIVQTLKNFKINPDPANSLLNPPTLN